VRHRDSVTSSRLGLLRTETQGSTHARNNSVVSNMSGTEEGKATIRHPVEPRSRTAILPPVLSKSIDPDPLCWLTFTQEAIITSCKNGMFTLPLTLAAPAARIVCSCCSWELYWFPQCDLACRFACAVIMSCSVVLRLRLLLSVTGGM
jgi:hypothetical protein